MKKQSVKIYKQIDVVDSIRVVSFPEDMFGFLDAGCSYLVKPVFTDFMVNMGNSSECLLSYDIYMLDDDMLVVVSMPVCMMDIEGILKVRRVDTLYNRIVYTLCRKISSTRFKVDRKTTTRIKNQIKARYGVIL
jgi:hypothetical protein